MPKVSTGYTHQRRIPRRRTSANDQTRNAVQPTSRSLLSELDALVAYLQGLGTNLKAGT